MRGFGRPWRAAVRLALLAVPVASCAPLSIDAACARQASREFGVTVIRIERGFVPPGADYDFWILETKGPRFLCYPQRDGTVSVVPSPPPNP